MISWMNFFAFCLCSLNLANVVCACIYDPIPIALLASAALMIMFITAIQVFKERILVDKKQVLSLVIFAALFIIDVYFLIVGLALLIYLQQISVGQDKMSSKFKNLMYQSDALSFGAMAAINLTFYLGNTVFAGIFTRFYYKMFWVNQIVFIYRYLRRKVSYLNESLMSHLPSIPVTQNQLQSVCPLCLQNYQLGQQTTKPHCEHIFHRNCIRIWVLRSNSCPLCRRRVIFS